MMEGTRQVGLARALSKLGYCSRSHAFTLINTGRVRLNGSIRRDPEYPVDLSRDRIEVDSSPVEGATKIYLMLNKPRGLVTTASDEKGRETIYSCLPPGLPWIGPVGRLDKASEGLLLLSNDSEWAARITDPASHVSKTYHVQVSGIPGESVFARMLEGVRDTNGDVLRARSVRLVRHGEHNAWLEIVLDQGKNRHIRRLLTELGFEVLRLIRIAIGPLQLGDLPKGATRPLSPEEKQAFDKAIE